MVREIVTMMHNLKFKRADRVLGFVSAALLTFVIAFMINVLLITENKFIKVGDLTGHYSWSLGMINGLSSGYIYPRWSAFSNLGLGEPSFYYYAPLTYYVCALVNLVFSDAWLSLRITALLANWATGLIVFSFVFTNRLPRALAGTFAVQASPIFFLVLSFNAAFAWASALPFYSLVFLLYARRVPSGAVNPGMAVAYAAACLTHILSGFMIGISLAGAETFWLIRYPTLSRLRASLGVGTSLVLGAALAGVYLVPAIVALRYASPAAITTGPAFDWHTTFAFASVTALLYGVRWGLYQYAAAAAALVPLLAGAARWWKDPARDRVEARLLVAGAAAMFFATELSAPLWFVAKPLHFIQFSYRFLAPASAAGLLACAWRLGRSAQREVAVWVAIAATVLCLLGTQAKLAAEGQTIRFQGNMERRLFSDSNMLPAAHGPDWLDYGKNGGFPGECTRLDLQCKVLEDQPQERRWRIVVLNDAPKVASVRLPAFAFPTWGVVVNGIKQKRLADPATGAIVARLTATDNLVELRWTPLAEERVGWMVSGVAVLLLIVLVTMRHIVGLGLLRPSVD